VPFIASNEVPVEWVASEDTTTVWLSIGGNYIWEDDESDLVAITEFLESEKDARLNRWRSPDYRNIVVYPVPDTTSVRVLNEVDVTITVFYRGDPLTDSPGDMSAVARAYFDAHPEKRPWHDAQQGDVWVVTYDGDEFAVIADDEDFAWPLDGGVRKKTDPGITAGRCIWTPPNQ
jgi:hypothetical protein